MSFESGRLRVNPDPAVVRVGSTVEWQCASISGLVQSWLVKFDKQPCTGKWNPWATTTTSRGFQGGRQVLEQNATIATAPVDVPGTYKYAVSIIDIETGQPLHEEDPVLIVR